MTIPIIPGPWSFLGGAGEAVGAFGQARNQRDMYVQQQAQQNAALVSSLIARGLVAPEALGDYATQQLFQSAGLPPINPALVEVPQATQQARLYGREVGKLAPGSVEAQKTAGLTTGLDVDVLRGQAATGRVAEQGLGGLSREQAQVVSGVPSVGGARAIQTAQQAGAQAKTAEAGGQQMIWEGVQEFLPKDEQFAAIARYAAVNGLGWLTSMNELTRRLSIERVAENRERIRMFLGLNTTASRRHEQAVEIWAKSMQEEIDRQLSIYRTAGGESDEMQTQIRNRIVKEFEAKRPQMGPFIRETLRDYNIDPSEYGGMARDIGGLLVEGGQNVATPQSMDTFRKARTEGHPSMTDEAIDASPLPQEQKDELKRIPYGGRGGVPPARPGFRPHTPQR